MGTLQQVINEFYVHSGGEETSHPSANLIANNDDTAAQNSENVDRLNIVAQSFSLCLIPATIIFLGQNGPVVGRNWRYQRRLAHAWAIFNKLTIQATKWWNLEPEKNGLIIYSTIVLTTVLFLWLIVASS
jgi:hypothetical protein